jgi:colanic acid biosynthesis glycosyl transferase WcaI
MLVINQARHVKDVLIPSKLLTYLASRRPVLAAVHPESEAARFIQKAGCGWVIEPEEPSKFAEAILRLKQAPELRIQMGERGLSFIRENYDRPVLLKRFEETLRNLVNTA